jgi:N-6 DNA Methylase
MTKTDIVSMFKSALVSAGYDEARIRRNYDFCDLTDSVSRVRRISLAAFAGYPQSYRNARVGVAFANGLTGDPAREYRALGAPLLMVVQDDVVQPWATGMESARPAGRSFPLQNIERVFHQNRESWGPEALGRVKTPGDVSGRSQPDLFDTGLVKALGRRFQTRLKELLEHSFKEIAAAYKEVHGRPPKVSPLFAFLFRFVTAKIFMDRADAEGWDGLSDPLEILKAAEKQTGLLERPDPDFRRKRILDAAWASVESTLHFQNLSVPDLAFVAESAFITERTRDELGIHSTPEGLADYIVNQLPWGEVPVDERVVWEPFCGHGVFLAKAMERLRQDIHPSVNPKGRHEYFRQRLIGVETDPLALEICRLMLTNTDYPNGNTWERLHHADVFRWPHWQTTLQSATVVLANPPYEAFAAKYRREIGAVKTKPPAEFLHRLLQQPPRLLGLVLPQSFLSDPIYRDANLAMARRYDSIQVTELPPIFRYADNETVAVTASGLRMAGHTVRINYAEVQKDGVDRFLEDWHVSNARSAEVPVPPLASGLRFTLRLLPQDSILAHLKSRLLLGKVADIHQGIHWIARTDGKAQSAPRIDVAANKEKKGFHPGAEKMSGNLAQFQLRTIRYLSLREEHQWYRDKAWKLSWGERKAVCNAARRQPTSPWRFVTWADAEGLTFTKQFFAIWPHEGVSEFAIAAIIASPVANAFSFERDLDRHNHIETLRELPLPDLEHLKPNAELHRRAAELQNMLALRDFAQPPTEAAVTEAVLRLDAAVLDAYELPASVQRRLLKMFNGWSRPLPPPYDRAFGRYFPDHFEDEITLTELVAITADWERTSERKTELIEKKIRRAATKEELTELQRLKFLTEARGEYFAPLPLQQLAAFQSKLELQGKREAKL